MASSFTRGATNFEDVPVAVSGSKRETGYLENFQVSFDDDLTRVQSTYIENIQYLNSGFQFNDGNDKWVLRASSDEMDNLRIQEGTYTGEELAFEITNRLSQDPFGIQGPPGIFDRSLNQFPYECIYDNIARIFTIKGGITTGFTGIFVALDRLNSGFDSSIGSPISPFAPLVSFQGGEDTSDAVPPFLLDPQEGSIFTVALPDSNNPGEFICTSSYQANGNFVVKPQTRSLAIRNFIPNISPIGITVSVGPIAGTYFDVALAMQTAINAAFNAVQSLEGFTVVYNTNNFGFQIYNDGIFGLGSTISPDRDFSVSGDTDDLRSSYSYISTSEIHATAPTFTIPSTAPGNEFQIDEGTPSVTNIKTITLPEVTTLTELTELTAILQTAADEALASGILANTYEITFSTRTARVRVKALSNAAGNFPPFKILGGGVGLGVGTAADTIYGFQIDDTALNNLIKKSDTPQFETGDLSLTIMSIEQWANAVMPLGIYSPEEAATELTKALFVAESGPLDRVTSVICSPADGYAPSGTGDYFDIPTSGSAISRFWFNVSAGNVAPSADGRTLVAVAITAGDTAATVAGILSPLIDAVGSLSAVLRSSFDEVVVTQTPISNATPIFGATAESQAKMTFTITQERNFASTENPLQDTFTAEYNDELKTYEISREGQILGSNSGALIKAATMGSARVFGFNLDADLELTGTNSVSGDSVTILYGPLYLYIKSNRLSDQKISQNSINEFYKNVIGKLRLNVPIGGAVFNDLTNDRVNRLALKTTVSTMDFRLVDEDGALYNTNGADWAFTIVFERF